MISENDYFFLSDALKIVDGSSSPNDIVEGKETSIECVFSGWPLPTIVHWFKEEKLITNGTDGIYHSMEKEGNNLRSTLYFPSGQEDQEGFYKCNANNSIPGWSSSAAYGIEMILWCKKKTIRKIMAPTFFSLLCVLRAKGIRTKP